MARAFVILKNDTGEQRIAVVGGGSVDRVVIGERPRAALDDADTDLALCQGDGVQRQKLGALCEAC